MKDNKHRMIAGFLALGALLIAFSLYFSRKPNPADVRSDRLARVDRETGKVFALRSGMIENELIEAHSTLSDLDSVETSDTGEALLSFANSAQIRVLNNALVTLEKGDDSRTPGQLTLILKRGEIKVENG